LYLESLLDGGFEGEIYPVHPRHKTLLGRKVYPSIEDVPDPVDLVIIALNQKITAQVMETCGRRGVKGVVCPAGGYKEMGEEGKRLESELASIARAHGMILIGPNTLGLSNAEARLNATFYPEKLPPGSGISVVSQSGGTGRAIIEELRDEGLGVSKWIGAGNRATIDFPECVEFLSQDKETRVIALFIEGTEKGRELMDAAAGVSRKKPVVVFKAANSALAQSSAVTHTGSMISSPRLFTEACRQFGLVEVESVSELVSVAKALTLCPPPGSSGIGVVTHTAGPSIIMMDILSSRGCDLAVFSERTMSLLEEKFHGIEVVLKNPLDAAAFGYTAKGYGEVAEILMADQDVGLLIAIHALHKRLQYAVPQLIALRKKTGKPVIACYISTRDGRSDFRTQLQDAGIPFFTSIERAAWAAAGCMNYKRIIDGKGTR
jgi:acetyltransferase